MKDELIPIIEWAVWGNLDSKNDLELLILKGHLLLEIILDSALDTNEICGYKNYSFYKKIDCLKKLSVNEKQKFDLVISLLLEINSLRNKLAHEYFFKIQKGELESWAKKILDNFDGTKYSKYTFRTKIVHGFSTLAKNIIEITKQETTIAANKGTASSGVDNTHFNSYANL